MDGNALMQLNIHMTIKRSGKPEKLLDFNAIVMYPLKVLFLKEEAVKSLVTPLQASNNCPGKSEFNTSNRPISFKTHTS